MLQISCYGDDTLSVVIKKRKKRAATAHHLRKSGVWIECVEGMDCVDVQFDAANMRQSVAEKTLQAQLSSIPRLTLAESSLVEVPVCYGGEFGPEFDSICEMLGLTATELITIHTSREHRVDLIGFTPGFAYLSGLEDEVVVPRLTDPRQRVAAGSIGIASGLTGVYALPGPGGWPLIGRTPIALFRPDDEQHFLLRTGMRVRFTAIDSLTFHRMATA